MKAMSMIGSSKIQLLMLALASSAALASHEVTACEDGHWVDSVTDDGRIVILEDGSIWEVDPVDQIDSALWLPTTEIVACDNKLINTEDGETVGAERIR